MLMLDKNRYDFLAENQYRFEGKLLQKMIICVKIANTNSINLKPR